MRAKFAVTKVETPYQGAETVNFVAVSDKPFDTDGASEDNEFARWTPSGSLSITIQNPNLIGRFVTGEKYYLDFTPAS